METIKELLELLEPVPWALLTAGILTLYWYILRPEDFKKKGSYVDEIMKP